MKTIIAGSRDITDYQAVKQAIAESGFEITTVLSGTCRGVDVFGERWAKENDIPIERFPAEWQIDGRAAGPRRNLRMASKAEALIAIKKTGESRGTDHMIDTATKWKLKVFVFTVK